jgi:hypothetical protein
VLCLLTASLLPGCAVSLFSEAKHNPDAAAKIKDLELRMDVIDAMLKQRSAVE